MIIEILLYFDRREKMRFISMRKCLSREIGDKENKIMTIVDFSYVEFSFGSVDLSLSSMSSPADRVIRVSLAGPSFPAVPTLLAL